MAVENKVSFGEHLDGFISHQIQSGRYSSENEVLKAGLQMLELEEQKLVALKKSIEEGLTSGEAVYSYEALMEEVDREFSDE